MGGKGDDNSSSSMMMQQSSMQPVQTEGGWVWKDTGTMKRPPPPVEEEEETETAAPITEDPTTTTGMETVGQGETQPYAPPGFGNYGQGTNLSPLGDALVLGMQAEPGKRGPVIPNYTGQV